MNYVDDYNIWIRNYFRMSFELTEWTLNLIIFFKIWNKDSPDVLKLQYNRDKIFERPIMNADIGQKESDNLQN